MIHGVDTANALEGVRVFQAGTTQNMAGELVVSGGRVLAVCALADTVQEAQKRAYAGVKAITWMVRCGGRILATAPCKQPGKNGVNLAP